MNYQHIYHAGNFADVLKHIILIQILESLKQETKPFFALDTHSARGRYNLKSLEAQRSGEHLYGISPLFYNYTPSLNVKPINDYLNIIKRENQNIDLTFYPGSPLIIKHYLRHQDRGAFCELNDNEFFKLHALFHNEKNIKLVNGDGYEALRSFLPPREKTGVVIIDPPFEQRNEILTLENVIIQSMQRWSNGIFMLWYPVKENKIFEAHYKKLSEANPNNLLFELELPFELRHSPTALTKTAVIVFNPPQSLSEQYHSIMNIGNHIFNHIDRIVESA